ncbi:MAG: type II toxin-antitoxin system VapC family toxin [Dehalococcoidia bacterium]
MNESPKLPRRPLVLDAFAIIALAQEEPAAIEVEELLEHCRRGELDLFMTVVNLGEVSYRIERRLGGMAAAEALGKVTNANVTLVDVDQALALEAAWIKAGTGMGYLDCFPAALAERLDAAVVTGDRGFAVMDRRIDLYWLPEAGR